MGIFSKKSKAPEASTCDVCGATSPPGERSAHERTHIAKISLIEPDWLPENLRAVAQGEYTFRCDRCNAFPSMKWPSEGAAESGLTLHLAVAHHAGMFASSGMSLRGDVKFEMIPVAERRQAAPEEHHRAAGEDYRQPEPQPEPSQWVPTVEMSTARPAVFALANAPISNDAQVRAAIAYFARLSERPLPEQAIHLIRNDPEVLNRPWIWLAAVMRQADAADDHHLAAAGLYWAFYWTSSLAPRIDSAAGFLELELDPIPTALKTEILALGVASASQLPEDFMIVGNETGQIYAGPLAAKVRSMLGV